MTVLSPRERAAFACFTDTVLAPAPPLPPVHDTDAVAAFDAWLKAAPKPNRIAARIALLLLNASRFNRRSPQQRLAFLDRIGGPGVESLRAAAAVSYYGDARVSALLGYAPRAR